MKYIIFLLTLIFTHSVFSKDLFLSSEAVSEFELKSTERSAIVVQVDKQVLLDQTQQLRSFPRSAW